MGNTLRIIILIGMVAALPGCGDKQDQAQRDEAAKQAIQQARRKNRR